VPNLRTVGGLLFFAAVPSVVSACGSAASPTSPAIAACTYTLTIGSFTAAPPPAGRGSPYASYFSATLLPAQGSVYLIDVASAPDGCQTLWASVSANNTAVQVSPAGGSGRGQVELFMPQNPGAQRSTTVAIAGQAATVTQAGR
jgi:hypothetical protein